MPPLNARERMRELREKLGMTTRYVSELSARIAASEANSEYAISHARVVQIEKGKSTPSIYKLASLSAIYGIGIGALMELYQDPCIPTRYHLAFSLPRTHRIDFHESTSDDLVVTDDQQPSLLLSQTQLLNELVKVWHQIPVELFRANGSQLYLYGVIGLSDYRMYPLLRPGSLVQIDPRRKPGKRQTYANEYERPLYFVETREESVCCWCDQVQDRLILQPHPTAPYPVKELRVPQEAEVIGRVIAIAVKLDMKLGVTARATGQYENQSERRSR